MICVVAARGPWPEAKAAAEGRPRGPVCRTLIYADFAGLCVFVLAFAHDVLSRSAGHTRGAGSAALVSGIVSSPSLSEAEMPLLPVLILAAVCSGAAWLYLRGGRRALTRALVLFPALAAWSLLTHGGVYVWALFLVCSAFAVLARMSMNRSFAGDPHRRDKRGWTGRDDGLLLISVCVVFLPAAYGCLFALNGAVDALLAPLGSGTNA